MKSASSNAPAMPNLIAQTSRSYRRASDDQEKTLKLRDATSGDLAEAVPWRRFRWARGQKHYSGTYWSATEAGHVIYESRLELSRLLYADFDPCVNRIVAQPFLLTPKINGQVRRHIPDFLLITDTDTGAVVVDVKPQHRLADPKVSSTFAWTRTVVNGRGWRYEVASEPPVIELANIRFLAGYRRPHLVDHALVRHVQAAGIDGATLAEAMKQVGEPAPQARATILHLMWTQESLGSSGGDGSGRRAVQHAETVADRELLEISSPPPGTKTLLTNEMLNTINADVHTTQSTLNAALAAHKEIPARLPLAEVHPGQQVLDTETKLIHHAIRIAAYNTAQTLARAILTHTGYTRAGPRSRCRL